MITIQFFEQDGDDFIQDKVTLVIRNERLAVIKVKFHKNLLNNEPLLLKYVTFKVKKIMPFAHFSFN